MLPAAVDQCATIEKAPHMAWNVGFQHRHTARPMAKNGRFTPERGRMVVSRLAAFGELKAKADVA